MSSITSTIEFCSHDPSIFVVTTSYIEKRDSKTIHDLHLLHLVPDASNSRLEVSMLEKRRMNDSYNPVGIGGPLDEGEELMRGLGDDSSHADESGDDDADSITSAVFDDTRNGSSTTQKNNINDRGMHTRTLSVAWIPATRKLVTVCWGQVWYWEASVPKKTLTLTDQDGIDANLITSGITTVISSLTKIGVEPRSGSGARSKNLSVMERLNMPTAKTIDPVDDCVILICGEPPSAKLLRIELIKTGGVSAIECKLDDVVGRSNIGFLGGCLCGEYCLVGCSNGEIMVVDLEVRLRRTTER